MDEIFHLPNNIPGIDTQRDHKIILHHYNSIGGSFHGRSILHMNAFSLVISGEKTMHFANQTVKINEGEFHFLSAGNCVVSMELQKAKPLESILIFFTPSILTDFYVKYDQKIKPVRDIVIRPASYVAFKKDLFILQFIEPIKSMIKSGVSVSAEMKLIKFEEILLYLLETNPKAFLSIQTSLPNHSDEMMLRKTVETNFTNKVNIEDLAFLCNWSVSTFKRKFAEVYQTSPRKWLLQKRMELARDLIMRHRERPSEIYFKVGYENHSSFSQAYKQYFGKAPSDHNPKQVNKKQQLLNHLR